MRKRLHVLIDDYELAEIQALARQRHQTMAEFVRVALRSARVAAASGSPEAKMRAIRDAFVSSYPSGEITDMVVETELGILGMSGN